MTDLDRFYLKKKRIINSKSHCFTILINMQKMDRKHATQKISDSIGHGSIQIKQPTGPSLKRGSSVVPTVIILSIE